jgi:signal peptidase I
VPGDIVLMDSPVEPDRVLVKRVISGEGDTVEVRNKVLYINNKKFDMPWKNRSIDKRIFPMNFTYRDNMPVIKLSRNQYFVLSDNLDHGYDSRNLGPISADSIIGKMIYKL